MNTINEARRWTTNEFYKDLAKFTLADAITLASAWMYCWDDPAAYQAVTERVKVKLVESENEMLFLKLVFDSKHITDAFRLESMTGQAPLAFVFALGDILAANLTLGLIDIKDYDMLMKPWEMTKTYRSDVTSETSN